MDGKEVRDKHNGFLKELGVKGDLKTEDCIGGINQHLSSRQVILIVHYTPLSGWGHGPPEKENVAPGNVRVVSRHSFSVTSGCVKMVAPVAEKIWQHPLWLGESFKIRLTNR